MAQKADYCLKYVKAKLTYGKYKPKLLRNKKFPDILNPEAMDFFVESTHKKYEQRFKKYFGREIKGIFTDEPSFYYGVWESDELPFYNELPEEYLSLTGNNFFDDYSDYYMQKGAPDFLRDCYKLLSDRMYISFTKKIADWCQRNNLYMTGHLMNDDLPTSSVQSNGNILHQLSGFSLPAVDDICSNSLSTSLLATFSVIQYASSGKDGAGAELFALGPCDMTFAKMRMMIWYSALFGVNHYFLAIAHLDVRGNAYRKYYFNNFSPDNPCSFAYRELGEEAKKAAGFARKLYIPDIYVRYPSELASYELFSDKTVNRRFGELLTALRKNQIQYMLIDDETDFDIPVIEFTPNGFSFVGTEYTEISTLIDNVKKKNLYTLPDGTLTDGIMVRRYADGKEVILNLTDNITKLNDTKGNEIILNPYEAKTPGQNDTAYKCLVQSSIKDITYEDINIVSATFDETGIYEFTVAESIELRLAKRTYPEDIDIWLDEMPVDACDNSLLLPQGFNSLYKQTKKIVLNAGKHKLIYKSKIKAFYKYLPEIMFVGDFYSKGNVFEKKSADSTISRYGRWMFKFGAELPTDKSLAISIENMDKPASLYADGHFVGTQIGYPYIWNIPTEYLGKKVQFTLKSASDLSNIFGDTSAIEKLDGTPGWCTGYTPAFQKAMPDIKVKILEII